MQKSAVHEHASRPPIVANAYGQREVRKTGNGRLGGVRQVWRNNCIQMVAGECIINCRAGRIPGERSRGDIDGIGRITWELFRQ